MIKITKNRKRKNPHESDYIEEIIGNIDYTHLDSGSYAHVYKFTLNQSTVINKVKLKPGKYILKLFLDPFNYSKGCKERFLKLSKQKLIPKIYIINEKYIIMDYINGIPLKKLLPEYNDETGEYDEKISPGKAHNLWLKIDQLLGDFHEISKSAHGDLNPGNIMVSKDLDKVWFIDPSCDHTNYFRDEDNMKSIRIRLLGEYD